MAGNESWIKKFLAGIGKDPKDISAKRLRINQQNALEREQARAQQTTIDRGEAERIERVARLPILKLKHEQTLAAIEKNMQEVCEWLLKRFLEHVDRGHDSASTHIDINHYPIDSEVLSQYYEYNPIEDDEYQRRSGITNMHRKRIIEWAPSEYAADNTFHVRYTSDSRRPQRDKLVEQIYRNSNAFKSFEQFCLNQGYQFSTTLDSSRREPNSWSGPTKSNEVMSYSKKTWGKTTATHTWIATIKPVLLLNLSLK